MASISFKYLEDKLILCYTPVIGLDDITKRLDTEDGVPIKHTFWVTKHLLCNDVEEDNDGEETLHFHIGTVGEVFVDELGERMRANYLTSAFPKFLEDHGLRRMRFHDLRHSCASLLLANGVPLKHIQEWLGHSDFTTTANIYAHLDYKSKITSAQAMETGLALPEGGDFGSRWREG